MQLHEWIAQKKIWLSEIDRQTIGFDMKADIVNIWKEKTGPREMVLAADTLLIGSPDITLLPTCMLWDETFMEAWTSIYG